MYLNCHSYYSLRYGTFSETQLLELAEANGIFHLALTDINSTSACMNFIKEARGRDVQPVVGVDVRNGIRQCYVILARNNNGFCELNHFMSRHIHSKKEFPPPLPPVLRTAT